MNLNWSEKSFLLGLLEKRLKEDPNCKVAKEIKERILNESPVLRRMIYRNPPPLSETTVNKKCDSS